MNSELATIKQHLSAHSPRRVSEPGARQAAVAVILVPRPGSSGIDLLLIERAARSGDPWSGQMGLPGGMRSGVDDELLDAAVREVREETSIALAHGLLLGELDDLFTHIKVLPKIVVRPFVFGLDRRPTVVASAEVANHVWISLDTLRISRKKAEVLVKGDPCIVDAFVVGEYVIWGMTHRILEPLLTVEA